MIFSPNRLRDLRSQAGLTLEELALDAKMVESTVRNYEKGRTIPNANHLARLAKVLDVQMSELYERER